MIQPADPPGFPAEIPRAQDPAEFHALMRRCTRCDLALSRTQVVPGAGSLRARVMFIGEAPGATEDQEGIPFVGASGRLLDQMLAHAGLTREEIFIANVVRCRPPANRNPRTREIRACAGWLAEQIRLIDPTLIVTLGRFALQHFIPDGKITQLAGRVIEIEYGDQNVRLFPMLHPAAVLRSPDKRPGYERLFGEIGELLGSGR